MWTKISIPIALKSHGRGEIIRAEQNGDYATLSIGQEEFGWIDIISNLSVKAQIFIQDDPRPDIGRLPDPAFDSWMGLF